MILRSNMSVFILLMIGQSSLCCQGKKQLPDFAFFQQLASALPEFPPCDDTNWIDPDYSSFLQTLRIGYIENMLLSLGIKDKKKSIPYLLNDLLDNLLLCSRNSTEENNTAILCLKEESKLFVWGDLHAAFHSFVRDLQYLIEQEVLDQDLKIKQKDCFFVLLGDAINRGPYSMATLCLILLLCYQNPSSVFYIKGNHETLKYWENFGLKRELNITSQHVKPNINSIKQKINDFFYSLKTYLLVYTEKDATSVLMFAFNGISDPYVNISLPLVKKPGLYFGKARFEDFYTQKDYFIPDVIFKTENWLKEHRAIEGLGLLDQWYGATAWAVFSAPIKVHEYFYGFDYDAFVLLNMGDSVRSSSVQLINKSKKDIRFSKHEPRNLLTGRLLSHPNPAPVGEDIVFGATMPRSQGLPVLSDRTVRGVNLALLEFNQAGGLNGTHIKYDVRNDFYSPFYARKNIKDFVERGIDLFLFPVGSVTLKSYVDLIANHQIAVVFPVTGSADFGDPLLKGIINLTAMHIDEISALIDFLTQSQAVKNFAFLFQEDEYGKETLNIAHALLKEKGITQWLDLPYVRGTVNFSQQIEELRKANIDALCLLCTADGAQEFIRQCDLGFLHNKTLFGLSTLGSIAFKNFVNKKGIYFYYSSRVPDPANSMLPIAKKYRKLMDQDYYVYDNASFEAYIGTRFLLDIMQNMNEPINKYSLIAEMEKIMHKNFEGLSLTYKKNDRSFNISVWLEDPNNDNWIEVPDKIS
ncbi:hypothetical protein EKK58_03235 [Candidatus Dependentiae bacterium]|nr:MAG: hypothetical protein EKK58_03235 [Candidatus Dependentiae bacterium]